MNNPRYLHNIYCDDVRLEANNKAIIIGVYNYDMIINPTIQKPIIQKLCIYSTISTPVDKPIKEIKYKLKLDNKVIQEFSENFNSPIQIDNETFYIMHGAIINITIPITQDSTLRLCASIDDEDEIQGAALHIKFN